MSQLTLATSKKNSAILRVIYVPANNGLAFTRNNGNSYCAVEVVSWPNGVYVEHKSWPVNGCRTQAQAYKSARKFVRENNIRSSWEQYV